mgnify:CR=1 FL=1
MFHCKPMSVQGAEARVEISEDKVIKKRLEQEYRHSELDQRIREERTREEKKNIDRARKYGANVPKTQKVGENILEQDRIKGEELKQVIESEPELMQEAGENLAKMHSGDIIHGDLTTSNMIISEDNELNIIDLGLSQVSDRVEDKAVDIHLLKQVLESSHPNICEKAWKKFLEGYKNYESSEEVLERLEEVESRGRYK